MANLSPAVLIIILLICVIVAFLIGYFLGSRLGGKQSVAMREVQEKHDGYKNDVREHFEQTSAIMSRMVDDYRDMYQHMSEGAEKLADMHPQKLVTPPPAPEAITRAATDEDASGAAKSPHRAGSPSGPNQDAVMQTSSSADRPWNKEGGDKVYGID